VSLSVAQAAEQWLQAKPAAKVAEKLVKEAEEVLKEHFTKTGRSTYKGLVGLTTTPMTGLDTAAVRADHGTKYDTPGSRRTLSDIRTKAA
jgi:hypothetical protein